MKADKTQSVFQGIRLIFSGKERAVVPATARRGGLAGWFFFLAAARLRVSIKRAKSSTFGGKHDTEGRENNTIRTLLDGPGCCIG